MIHLKSAILAVAAIVFAASLAHARTKLVALPDRGATVIRLDNSQATLIEEERVLTLQKGVNKVDFAWAGVSIDPDSIRLAVLSHPDKVILLNVSYPPGEAALIWEISSQEALEEKVRISYLLSNIDRLVTYKAIVDRDETKLQLKGFIVLRNFSGEDFDVANVVFESGQAFERGIKHEETKQLAFLNADAVKIEKVWKFDAAALPWDPETVAGNVGIPVQYRFFNTDANGLGKTSLRSGKIRVFQDDGRESTIFSGEDMPSLVAPGEKMEVYIGDSRDIVVTQRKMDERRINVRKNNANNIVLYDTDETITAKIENFKDKKAVLTLVEHILGQWDMEECNFKYERKDAETLEFQVELPPNGKQELKMRYHRRNIRPGQENVSVLGR